MFLTKKSLQKILLVTAVYFVLGSACILLFRLLSSMGLEGNVLLVLGIITYLLCPIVFFGGRYAEGEGKLINLGNKWVRKELKPAEFIKHYEQLREAEELVVNRPSVDALRVAVTAYDLLGDREKALETVDEMICIASEKKKNMAKLLKASLLFSYGEVQAADMLFSEVQTQTLDMICVALSDAILKSDRAMALGDYKTVEAYCLKTLSRPFPKPDKIDMLVCNYQLAKAYENSGEADKAITHYQYCADFGGETEMKSVSAEKLRSIS